MARLVKVGHAHTLPPEGEYTPEEQFLLRCCGGGQKRQG